jgi:hypothetical protein
MEERGRSLVREREENLAVAYRLEDKRALDAGLLGVDIDAVRHIGLVQWCFGEPGTRALPLAANVVLVVCKSDAVVGHGCPVEAGAVGEHTCHLHGEGMWNLASDVSRVEEDDLDRCVVPRSG